MPNKISSKKDLVSSRIKNLRNLSNKSKLRTFEKNFLENKTFDKFNEFQKLAQSLARRGIISSQKASRKISKCHNLYKETTGQSVVA